MITLSQTSTISKQLKQWMNNCIFGNTSVTSEAIENISISILNSYRILQFSFIDFTDEDDVLSYAIFTRLMDNSKYMLLTYDSFGIIENLLPYSKRIKTESHDFKENHRRDDTLKSSLIENSKRSDETSVINSTDDIYKITNPTEKVNQNKDTSGDLTSGIDESRDHFLNDDISDEVISPSTFKEYFENLSKADLYSVVRKAIDYFIVETNQIIY